MGGIKVLLEVCHKMHHDLMRFIFRNGPPSGGLFFGIINIHYLKVVDSFSLCYCYVV